MVSAIFDGFLVFFDLAWCQLSPNGVPIVLMMLAYGVRARLVQQNHQHNWDPDVGCFDLK